MHFKEKFLNLICQYVNFIEYKKIKSNIKNIKNVSYKKKKIFFLNIYIKNNI